MRITNVILHVTSAYSFTNMQNISVSRRQEPVDKGTNACPSSRDDSNIALSARTTNNILYIHTGDYNNVSQRHPSTGAVSAYLPTVDIRIIGRIPAARLPAVVYINSSVLLVNRQECRRYELSADLCVVLVLCACVRACGGEDGRYRITVESESFAHCCQSVRRAVRLVNRD